MNILTSSIDNLWPSDNGFKLNVKKSLEKSCCLYRLQTKSNNFLFSSILDERLTDLICLDDLDLANNIREFYSKKIIMAALNQENVSSFRKDLAHFLANESENISDKTVGLVQQLPHFYVSDKLIQKLKEHEFKVIPKSNLNKLIKTPFNEKIVPLNSCTIKIRGIKNKHYFFKTKDNSFPVVIKLQYSNPLIHLWEHIFDNSNEIEICDGKVYIAKEIGFNYIRLDYWKINNKILLG